MPLPSLPSLGSFRSGSQSPGSGSIRSRASSLAERVGGAAHYVAKRGRGLSRSLSPKGRNKVSSTAYNPYDKNNPYSPASSQYSGGSLEASQKGGSGKKRGSWGKVQRARRLWLLCGAVVAG